MSKALEAFGRITLHTEYDNESHYDGLHFEDDCKLVDKALQRLEAIDNANPSEALKCLEYLIKECVGNDKYVFEPQLETIKQSLERLEQIDNANPSEALECLECLYCESEDYRSNDRAKDYETIKQALLKAEKDEKIILGIEDYLNRRIKVSLVGDVRKAFIEIRNQLQVIKEVLE